MSHDGGYQWKRQHPDYAGWDKQSAYRVGWEKFWQPFIQQRAFPTQGKLLELGCGAGNLSIELAKRGYDVVGVDIAPTAIDWAREHAAQAGVNVTFLQGDILELSDFEDESFDIVFDGLCLHCIIGSDRARWLQVAHQLLKPQGVLTITSGCNVVLANLTPTVRDEYDPDSCCLINKEGVATRYFGDSNDILLEVIEAQFRIRFVELLPPENEMDQPTLQVIAEKYSGYYMSKP